jgi:hypothetical protein
LNKPLLLMVWCTSSSRHWKKQDLHSCVYKAVCRTGVGGCKVRSGA